MRDEQSRNHADVLRHVIPEIHNALAVILGNAQLLLLGTRVNPEDRAKLKAIERGSFRIQTLVEELMQERGFTSSSLRSLEHGANRRQQIRAVVP
jgi:nitrogen-specific signal transduction histidine kinase